MALHLYLRILLNPRNEEIPIPMHLIELSEIKIPTIKNVCSQWLIDKEVLLQSFPKNLF